MRNYAINGRFLTRTIVGQERFALELISELDKLVPHHSIELIAPNYAVNIPPYKNIKVVKYGGAKSHFWEQIDFWRYLVKHRAISINLCNLVPLLKPGIAFILDIGYKANSKQPKGLRAVVSTFWHCIHYKIASRYALHIVTISEFCKKQICDIYHVPNEKVSVIGCGWQHFIPVAIDESIFNTIEGIQEKKYYFMLGSLLPHKNIEWMLELAKRHPKDQFVVAGKHLSDHYVSTANVHFVGYISDEQVKALMSKCKAFLFPSFYEGFGIPPLEALSVGVPIVVSNTTCLPEIYENSAHYIDPTDTNVDLDQLLQEPVEDSQRILDKYSWEKSGKQLYELIRSLD